MIAALASASATAPLVRGYDVLISAGHEGRPQSCARFPERHCYLGTAGEREWTPIVADAATHVLRDYGIRVVRLPADYPDDYAVRVAVFIHFDGSAVPCRSGASVGYPSAKDRFTAALWKRLYGRFFRFGFRPDNFSIGLREYYGYDQARTADGAYVLELGEMTCPAQRGWLAPRLRWIGALVAFWIGRVIDRDVPFPRRQAGDPR
ncbi:MAG TPA: hypothetical protein VMV82_01790 [Candidatus Dormibacteraeota bacterium]|nr:hypothetical protein [Candidatus Dormibacteraeota bacterium]